jgi:IS605 OrfB family transposase
MVASTKKKNREEKDSDRIVNRCQCNRIKLSSNKIWQYVIPIQFEASKCIYNQALYCQRTWYSRILPIILKYYCTHLFVYRNEFSTQDKLTLFKFAIWKKDFVAIGKLLTLIRPSETDDFCEPIRKLYDMQPFISENDLDNIEKEYSKCFVVSRNDNYNKISYYYDQLSEFGNDFSIKDKLLLLNIAIRKKDIVKIGLILAHIHQDEEDDDFCETIQNLYRNYNNNDLNRIEDEYSKWLIKKNDSKIKNFNSFYNLQSVVDIINKIKPVNFKDSHGDMKDFVCLLRKSFVIKINNQRITGENKQRSRTMVGTKSQRQKKAAIKALKKAQKRTKKNDDNNEILTKPHLIPSSYIDITVVEQYIAKQFEADYKKKLFLRDNDDELDETVIINQHEMLGSQVLQQTLKKLDDAYDSYFKGEKANPPQYLKKNHYNLIFQKTSMKIITRVDKRGNDARDARLSLGLKMKKDVKRKYPESEGYLLFKVPDNIKEDIQEIEITPTNDKRYVKISFKYNKNVPIVVPISIPALDQKANRKMDNIKIKDKIVNKIMAIDVGVNCLAVCVCFGLDHPILYDGAFIKYINRYYKNKITGEQSRLIKRHNKYTSKYIDDLWGRRERKIRNQLERITTNIMMMCKSNDITEIIIGYNENWKNGVKLGRTMNDVFYKIPFRKFIKMMFYKGRNNGIKVKECNESYTSKCDALNLEEIGFHKIYSGERRPRTIRGKKKETRIKGCRGLFQSALGVLINADVNGAINIMRKGTRDRPELLEAVEDRIRRINYGQVCNPIRRQYNF